MAPSPYLGQSYGLSPKLSYLRWRKSTQRFSAQSKDCLLDARYLLCVISLVLAASPALPRRLLEHRVSCNPTSGCIPVYTNQRTHDSWKLATKRLLNFIQICRSAWIVHSFRLVRATSLLGSLPPIAWALTLTNTKKTRNSNFRIRLLTGCDGLKADASRFRQRRNGCSPNDPSCKLCEVPLEDSLQFVAFCPALQVGTGTLFFLIFPLFYSPILLFCPIIPSHYSYFYPIILFLYHEPYVAD